MSMHSRNLTMHRSPANVWSRESSRLSRARSAAALGFLLIGVGTALVARAYLGEIRTLRRASALRLRRRPADEADAIAVAADDSFPASDPPGWTSSVGKPAGADR